MKRIGLGAKRGRIACCAGVRAQLRTEYAAAMEAESGLGLTIWQPCELSEMLRASRAHGFNDRCELSAHT